MKKKAIKKKVYVGDLEPGVYVVELDRPWTEIPFKPPFDIQGFLIGSLEDLEEVRRFCRYVYIDLRLGKDVKTSAWEEGEQETERAASYLHIPQVDLRRPVYPDKNTVENELSAAREIIKDTRQVYSKILDDIVTGKSIDAVSVQKVIGSMVESIVRNPDALTWLSRLKGRDVYTYAHSIAVCVLALTFGRYLGIPEYDLRMLGIGTLLQDIGKLKLPKELLEKSEDLIEEEYELLKKHVDASVEIMRKQSSFPEEAIEIVYCHHERYDAGGYPRGLKGDRIGILCSVAGIVDTYEAMTNERPYRPARTSYEALMTLYGQRNNAFHAAIVEHLTQCIGIFPVGSFVELNTAEVGVVVSRNRVHQLKPKIIIILDPDRQRLKSPTTINLADQAMQENTKPWRITRAVDPKTVGIDTAEFFL